MDMQQEHAASACIKDMQLGDKDMKHKQLTSIGSMDMQSGHKGWTWWMET
jgi:hypothetical protein